MLCSADPSNAGEGLGAGSGPIDWNCNGQIESGVQADINLDVVPTSIYYPFTLLTGYDDWAHVHAYLNTPHYRNGIVRQNPEVISCARRR